MRACLAILIAVAAAGPAVADDAPLPTHAMTMHGAPLYGPDFAHLAYANPDAPRGGELSFGTVGSFDSLNPFIVIGRTAAGVRQYHFASLMARTWDEPFSLYGYVAETVEVAPDRRAVAFHLNPAARFHDGTPITVDDVVFTMETLREHGLPGFRRNYRRIARVERVGERGVRFHLTAEADRETPMIIGLMPILSRAYYADRPFDQTTLEPPLGSGPYRIAEVEPGRRIVYERVPDWWAADLPVFRGHFNIDRLRFDYYLDQSVAMQAFRAGAYNFRREPDGMRWATDYDFPAVRDGDVTLLDLPHRRPSGLHALAFNTRRPPFDDRRVREALAHAFDSAWIARNLLQDRYQRITGLFTNSVLAPDGPPGPVELALLEPWRGSVPDAVFGEAYRPPGTEDSSIRDNLRVARRLLMEAGWTVQNGALLDGNGRPLSFEVLLGTGADERPVISFADTLGRIGIEVSIRRVDSAQQRRRLASYDFDVVVHRWNVTLSPGAEQDLYWGSASADVEGTQNLPGIRDPAIDALIDALENAGTDEELRAAAAALDRVLMWGHYFIPLFYQDTDHIAFWGELRYVDAVTPVYGTVIETWWQGEPPP